MPARRKRRSITLESPPSSFAIVVPWLHGIRGHRVSINLARELADRGARVDFLVGRMNRELVGPVSSQLGKARPSYLGYLGSGRTSILRFARYQYSRSSDRALSKAVAIGHQQAPYDVVLVASNEGHWIAAYLRKRLGVKAPLLAVCVRELVEHPLWLGYERRWSHARKLFSPLYPLFHQAEAERLREFDRVYSISPWTSLLLDYFYGIRRSPTLAMVDRTFYDAQIPSLPQNYVAVPTAALDREGVAMIQAVARAIPNLRTYGPTGVPGIPHEGFLSDPDLVSFVGSAAATLFVFDYEALGLIPLESLAAGTPVVTLPKQGPRVLLTGNPGVRFGTTPEELSAGLRELMPLSRDPAWRRELRASVGGFHPQRATNDFLSTLGRSRDGLS